MHDFPCMLGGGGTRGANISQYLASQPQSNHRRPLTTLHTITATSLSLALCISLASQCYRSSHPTQQPGRFWWDDSTLQILQGNQILLVSAVTGHVSVFQSICPQSGLKLRSWGIESTRADNLGPAQKRIISGSGGGIMGNTRNKTCIACWGVEANHRVRKIVL